MTDKDITTLQNQLSLRHYHLKHSKTDIFDHFIAAYAQFTEHTLIDFMDWCKEHCDRPALTKSYGPTELPTWLVEKVLRRE
jgi:hypothetical protein